MSNSVETLSPFRAEEDPQAYVLASSLGYIWDVGTLEWIKDPGGGGGGGPVTIADGADVAQGSISDAAWVAGDGTVIALLKKIASAGGGAVSIADGSDVAEGATTDAAVVTDAAGTVSGKLRGLVKWAFERMPASLGQKAMTASLPVVIASDQSAVPVSGPLTDAQLRAVAVPVSGTVTASGPLTDAELRATPVPVSGTVTASGPLTDAQLRATPVPVSGAITNTTLSVVGGGAEATALRVTVANDSTGLLSVDDNGGSLTVDAPVGTPVFVRLSDGAAPIATLPISAASLPLPTLAATSTIQTDKSQFTKITDGTDTALVTAAGEVNVIATAQPGVDIGDVTINNAAGASAVNIQDGGNTITVDGTVAVSGSVAVTGPLTDAQLRATSVPVSMGVTDLTPSAPTAASVGVASAQAVAAAATRKGLVLVNTSNARISLGFGSAAVLDSGITLYPGGVFEMDSNTFDVGAVNAIASAAASNLGIQEYTT